MVRQAKVLRNYSEMSPLEQGDTGANIKDKINARPDIFIPAELPVTMAALGEATTLLFDTYNAYKNFGEDFKQAFVEAQAAWVAKMNLLADFVEFTAHKTGANAGSTIQLSGFKLQKTETGHPKTPAAPDSEMQGGPVKGTVDASIDKLFKGQIGFFYAVFGNDVQVQKDGNQITLKVGG